MKRSHLPGLIFAVLSVWGQSWSAYAQSAGVTDACAGNKRITPEGQEGSDIQYAIQKSGAGSTVVLSGDYVVDRTIKLLNDVTLCSAAGATLTWQNQNRSGMMLDASRATGTSIKNLVLDGRGILLKGTRHTVENNLIRNIPGDNKHEGRWGEKHGILIADRGVDISIKGNVFRNIGDTCVMGYGISQSTISDNLMQNVHEGIHLFSVGTTSIRKNAGQGFKAMSIEIQGDDLPGLVIENNSFSKWHKDHEKGAYAMSVVSGISAIVRGNSITGAPLMAAGLEVGGQSPQILSNIMVEAPIVITGAPDAVIKGNLLTRSGIFKDINRARRGTLTIQDNTIVNAPRVAIGTDHWWGHEQVIISGNRISKQLTAQDAEFVGILTTDSDKMPLIIQNNQISIQSTADTQKSVRAMCIGNSGYKGNMRGTQITGNSCESNGVAIFANSNSLGGHVGISYRNNRLLNLKDSIQGDSEGLVSSGNVLNNVSADQARLKDAR